MYYWWQNMSASIRNEKGAVSVEAALYFMIFFMLCTFLADLNTVFLNKGHIERINYSLANILRERTRFYGAREELTQADVNELNGLALTLLADSKIGRNYHLLVEAVYFESDSNKEKKIKTTATYSAGTRACLASQPALRSTAVTGLSPWVENSDEQGMPPRWLPVYQITLCVPGGESLFNRFLNIGRNISGNISVSNAVIPR